MKKVFVRAHRRRGTRGVRSHYRNLYVDKDFNTRATHDIDGKLSGRERNSRSFDFTAPIRNEKGEIVGRASLKSKSVKKAKTVYGILPVREVGI